MLLTGAVEIRTTGIRYLVKFFARLYMDRAVGYSIYSRLSYCTVRTSSVIALFVVWLKTIRTFFQKQCL